MSSRTSLAVLLAACLLAPAATVMARRHPVAADWVPAPTANPRLRFRGERAIFTHGNLTIQVERLDGRRRKLFLKSAGLETPDPFDPDVLGLDLFTFLLRVENLESQAVELRPQNFFLITRRPVSNSTPCDFSCLTSLARQAGFDSDSTRKFLSTMMDSSESIAPGGRLSKLLVYTRMPESFKDFVLDLDLISMGIRQTRFVIPYHVARISRKRRQAAAKNSGAPAPASAERRP
ncbi:MAG: hypothetical protein ACE5ID_03330 [Acidobacteriota bacterium]